MKKCLVIYNPNSGKISKNKIDSKFQDILIDHGYTPTFKRTDYAGHATEIIRNSEFYDLVISVGGDGTFNEAISGNFKRDDKLLLAHIPLGTTNDIGAMFGYGKNIYDNLKMTLSGVEREIDICTVNDKPFVYVSGFGKFMNVPYETPRALKKKIGYLAYILNGIKSFNTKTPLYELEFDVNGEKYKGLYSFAVITNANRIAGINNIYDNIKLDDNKFEVLLSNLTKKKDIVNSLRYLITNDITKVPGFYFYRTDEMTIRFKRPIRQHWCLDGEEFKSNSLEYIIKINKGIRVLIPVKNVDKLFER